MDLVTQGVLGAVVGQAGFSRSLGRRALGWGTLIGMLPDLDVIVKFSSNPFAGILYHRGITHSIWFGPVIGPLLGYFLWRYYARRDSLSAWIGLSIWALITHPLLDLFTVYGTQLLSPFSSHRFTLAAVPIIDPIYTGILSLSLIFGCVFHRWIRSSIVMASVALTVTSAYLFYGLAQNEDAYDQARTQLTNEGHPLADVKVYTTMFQIFLRRVVVHFPNEIWVGVISTWSPKKIVWHKLPLPQSIRHAILNHPYGKLYKWFTRDELIFRPHSPGDQTHWDMLDGRFGSLQDGLYGLWGYTFTVDGDNIVPSDFRPFMMPLKNFTANLKAVWTLTFDKEA